MAKTNIYFYNPHENKWGFEIHISKTRKLMHKHISAMILEWGRDNPTDIATLDTRGMFTPFHVWQIKDHDGSYGAMFLNEEDLYLRVIAHECLHAAMARERYLGGFNMKYGAENAGEDEERLAYAFDDILQTVCVGLLDRGHHIWKSTNE